MLRSITPAWVTRAREQSGFDHSKRNASDLKWKIIECRREPRAEARAVKVGTQLLLIGGYQSLDRVLSAIDVFDFVRKKWIDRVVMPPGVPQTHSGVCVEEDRFIYLVAGQLGPQCSPAIADCFVFDTRAGSWGSLPSLPEPRYSPIAAIWDGRLHVVSGAKSDRWTSALEHWSIAVRAGNALDRDWQREPSIPKGGPHRGSAKIAGKFYIFGGQDGDMKPIMADPCSRCDSKTPLETLYGDSFGWDVETSQWKAISPMPAARTHSESEVVTGRYAIILGGNEGRHRLSDFIQVYDSVSDRWRIAGRLPYCMKTASAYHDGSLYLMMGQRSASASDLRPDAILNTVWSAEFDPATVRLD